MTQASKQSIFKLLVIVSVQLLLIGAFIFIYFYFKEPALSRKSSLPENKRMNALISTIGPIIDKYNAEFIADKKQLARGENIMELAHKYDVDIIPEEFSYKLHHLEKRTDAIPVGLLVAVAWHATNKLENREMLEKNNLFDQRNWLGETADYATLTVPEYELKSFPTVDEGVRAFMMEMNTEGFFDKFRNSRDRHRQYVGQMLVPSDFAEDFSFYHGQRDLAWTLRGIIREFNLNDRFPSP